MSATSDFERTIVFAESSIGYMKANKTPAYPSHYELWYTYASGFNRGLNDAINTLLKRYGKVAPSEVAQIYDEHLSPQKLGTRVETVGGLVSDEIAGITELLDGALNSTNEYGTALSGANETLSEELNQKNVAKIVRSLMAATEEMEGNNKVLERKLLDSKEQIQELKDSIETIRFESLTDELTGIANRKCFDQAFARALQTADKGGASLSLLLCDIDHFKAFNDTYGHQTGDQVLRLVGHTLKNNVKGRDLAARYGGEEFAVILPETLIADAVTVAEAINDAVRNKELVKRSTGETLGRVTMSIGVAALRPGDTVDSLIHRADVCLYAAKGAGRDRVVDQDDPSVQNVSKVA